MRLIRQLEFKLLWPFYVSQLIQSIFILTTAYWTVYFLGLGYSIAQISLLPVVMLLTVLILELPTGFLADLKGRKWVVVSAIFIQAISVGLVPFASLHFEMLIILYIIMGIGAALASGALEAWVVDFLYWHTKPNTVPSYYSALYSLMNGGFIIAPILASTIYFMTGKLHYLWWIESVMFFAAGLVLMIFAKEKRMERTDLKLKAGFLFQETIIQFHKRPMLIFMILAMFFLAMIFGATNLIWQPFLQAKGISLEWFGILFAFTGIAAVLYPIVQKTLVDKIGNHRLLQFISLVQMIAFCVLAIVPFTGVVILFLVLQNLDSVKLPIFKPWFQKQISSRVRSILGSILAMVSGIGESIGYLIAGQLTETMGINIIWIFAALLSAIVVIILAVANLKPTSIENKIL